MTYLEDGRCSLSNNLSENSIRPVTVGRKNWLFSDTPEGATANSLYLTMIEMAKALVDTIMAKSDKNLIIRDRRCILLKSIRGNYSVQLK